MSDAVRATSNNVDEGPRGKCPFPYGKLAPEKITPDYISSILNNLLQPGSGYRRKHNNYCCIIL